jgi:diguanylate cyclase (GGDEF)-like protein
MNDSGYILLVEDNPGDARLTQLLLEDAGSTGASTPLMKGLGALRWVTTALEAVRILESQPGCRAVLLDLGLPDTDGLQALQDIVGTSKDVPVIVMTGDERASMAMDAVIAGAQDFLVKGSFDAAMLARCIALAGQRKRAELALLDRYLRDELTGLPKRLLLLDRIRAAMAHCARTKQCAALLFIDLDHFKAINDGRGHAAGDRVLQVVASRLVGELRASDTAARIGGDEFVVLLPDVDSVQAAVGVATMLLESIRTPTTFEGVVLQISASIGVAMLDGTTDSATDVMKRADAAMYAAKEEGRGAVRVLG